MPQAIVRGNPITLDGLFFSGDGAAVSPVDAKVSIFDPNGATVLNLAAPTNVGVGHFQFEYAVAADAELGAWAIRWFGTVEGLLLTTDEGFTVTRAASSSPAGSGTGTTCSPWATHEDAPASLQVYPIDPVDVDDAFQAATDILYELTGRRYPGICTDYIRPQAMWRKVEGVPRWWPSTASFGTGSQFGWCSCHRGRETGCTRVPEIKLPGHPVIESSIVVKLDGDEFSSWRLDDGRFLVRVDEQGWPCCQRLLLDDDQVGTFSIAYSFGALPDIGGIRSNILLGTQIFSEWFPGQAKAAGCSPPQRATRVTRAGTTVDLVDPKVMIEEGITGIVAVDRWVASKALGRARRRATVLVPGKHRSARRPFR